jgi:hypothetical protein
MATWFHWISQGIGILHKRWKWGSVQPREQREREKTEEGRRLLTERRGALVEVAGGSLPGRGDRR